MKQSITLLNEAATAAEKQKSCILQGCTHKVIHHFHIYLKKEYTIKQSEVNRFDKLYERHLKTMKLKGKTKKTIDAYSRAVRRVRDYFDCCPDR